MAGRTDEKHLHSPNKETVATNKGHREDGEKKNDNEEKQLPLTLGSVLIINRI